jgi:serine/threonine protein kinase
MKDIIAGFIEMSENQYLHRDLKLANIFMSSGRALIADFGFAKKHSYPYFEIETSSRRRNITLEVLSTCLRKH